MTRVIVHAGYHKTGTTSLQDFLHANRTALAPHLRYFGKADFLAAGAHARIYAQRPFPWRLWRFRRSLRRFLSTVKPGGTIVLSRETFSGGMPGHRKIGGGLMMSYAAPARALARVIVAELWRRFGQDTDITFFYTTRECESWIRSVHGHLLRSIRLTQDFDSFRAQFPNLKGPQAEAEEMARTLTPIPVITAALEDYHAHPEGPAAAILDLLDIPAALRATLKPAPRSNTGQSDTLRADLLALNRQTLAKPALKAAKEAAIRERAQAADTHDPAVALQIALSTGDADKIRLAADKACTDQYPAATQPSDTDLLSAAVHFAETGHEATAHSLRAVVKARAFATEDALIKGQYPDV